jgi:N-acetylglutamate synthase-like GNAT family acetyltransferase
VENVTIQFSKLKEILPVRHRVLRAGLPLATAYFPDDEGYSTFHFAAIADGKVVGCVTLISEPFDREKAWMLRGMAIDPEYQRRSIGKKLLAFCEEKLYQPPLHWCNARVSAVPFYEKNGWRTTSGVFEVEGVGPHRQMMKTIKRSI